MFGDEGQPAMIDRSRYCTCLRAAVVKLSGLTDAQPPRAQHEGLLDRRLTRRRLGLGEVDRPAVAALGRVEEHVEQEFGVGGSSLTMTIAITNTNTIIIAIAAERRGEKAGGWGGGG